MLRSYGLFLRLILLGLPALVVFANSLDARITIRGSNGVEVEFVALFDAKPEGLVALVTPDGSAITIPWARIDLDALKANRLEIHRAYERAVATQKDQPIGMGLAENMLSLGQLQGALRQAVKDPYNWNYYGYSYQTITTDSAGNTIVRTYTRRDTRYPPGYVSAHSPFIVLKRLRDATDDSSKKTLMERFKMNANNSYGINTVIERINYTLSRLPPERMFPRQPKERRMVQDSIAFCKVIEEMLSAPTLTRQHQDVIKSYFSLIELD